MNSSKPMGIIPFCLLSVFISFAAEITDPEKFNNIALTIVMETLEPQGIEKKIISQGWSNNYESEERIFLLKKYDEQICTPLEDSPQSRKWANEIYTVLVALSFLSEDFGGDEYLQLAKYHTAKALNSEGLVPYLLLNEFLEYWLRMRVFQYHEKKGLTTKFLETLKRMEFQYKKNKTLTERIQQLKSLIKN